MDRLQKAQAEECVWFSWFILLFHCSIVWLCCSPALSDIHYTSMARYNLFVLQVLLNNNKSNQTTKLGRAVCSRVFWVFQQYNLVPANGWWCSAAREVTRRSGGKNGNLPPCLWLRSPACWLPRTGVSSGTPYARFEYGSASNFTLQAVQNPQNKVAFFVLFSFREISPFISGMVKMDRSQ